MSDLLEYKGFNGTVEYSAEDKTLYGKVLGVKGYLSYVGNSLENLKQDFEDMIDEYLATCADDGVEPQVPYKGKFNVRISPELHRALAAYSITHGQSLNSTVEEAIKKYVIS